MANPRKHTCRLLEMVHNGILSADDVMTADLSYMSESDAGDMMHMNQWNSTIDDGTEENETEEESEEDKISVGDTVTIDGVEYVAMQGPDRWGRVGCAGIHNPLCRKLPGCGGLIFVRRLAQ